MACQKALMDWRKADILAEKIGRVNRANLKAPIITGQPKTQFYEFCKDWALFKTDAGLYVQGAQGHPSEKRTTLWRWST